MKISELVDQIAETTDASKTDTRKVLDALVEAMTAAAQKGEEISLPDFGKFKVKAVPAREDAIRRPATRSRSQPPASWHLRPPRP
ncbi:HU family DNA-binding protein [Komagataeibacter oboediens]|uniref:HU family DNA-binding protein n=1 Tax=Komagataeibacter oboediens TaxID=65958 RepID=UPI0038D1F7B3